jgi:hypothetical protein
MPLILRTHAARLKPCPDTKLRSHAVSDALGEEAIMMNLLRQEIPTGGGSVEADYQVRLAELNRKLSSAQRRRRASLVSLAACVVLLLFCLAWPSGSRHASVYLFPALGVVYFTRNYIHSRRASLEIALRCGFYERGLERLRLDWKALDRTGAEFARDNHLYQFDLQIIGERSLFSLLCTTRSEAGAARLAQYFLDPADREEVIARQDAVRELQPLTALREAIALVGRHQFLGCDHQVLREWMGTPQLHVPPIIPGLLFLCGSTVLLLAILCFARLLIFAHTWPAFIPLLVMQAAFCGPLFRSVRSRLNMLRRLTNEVSVLQQGLQLLQAQQFASPRLKTLVDSARTTKASQDLLRLDRLLRGVVERDKDFFAVPSLLTAAGTQLVLAVERWRSSHREHFGQWIDTWAEFDALNAIACYAWEHPNDIFPAVETGAATLHLQGLGHPLLFAEQCVRNDVVLDEWRRFWILSGSNMAGKSTLLRAIGMNLVLAYAGAPIRATSGQFSLFSIGASISLSDSLLDGKSKFLAEAERLRGILNSTGAGRPVLFLIDEILSGTNSRDRFAACRAIVRALLACGAVGILSTHDLVLTSIADEPGLNGMNCCMESDDPGEPLKFDYLVKPGCSRSSSAIAIIRLFGIDAGSE